MLKPFTRKSAEYRRMLTSEAPLIHVWGGTAHQAQLAEATGFKAFGVSGAMTNTTILGYPDAGLITATELITNVTHICRSVSIPVIVDCDTGFGNAINVRRTVAEVIQAGAAGLFIEDQVAPKRCGFVKGKELVSLEEAVGKYRAALDIRDELDPDVIIMARTDARGAVGGSLDEALRRGEAYLKAGVDVLYVEALQTREEVRKIRETFPEALLFATTHAIRPMLTPQEEREFGFCMEGLAIGSVGTIAMYDFLKDYQARGAAAQIEHYMGSMKHPLGGLGIFDLTGFPKVMELEQKYLEPEKLERYDASLGTYDPRKGHLAGEGAA